MAKMFEERGIEVYFSSLTSQLVRSSDVLVAYVHWRFIQNGLKCIGKGEDFVANVHASELMPIGWNTNEHEYTLKYVNANGESYLLKVIFTESTAFIAFQHAAGANECASTQIELEKLYALMERFDDDEARRKSIGTFIADSSLRAALSAEIATLTRAISNPEVCPTANPSANEGSVEDRSSVEKPSSATSDGSSSLMVRPNRPVASPFDYGRADLDPFAGQTGGFGSGSGMLFDPLRIGGARQPLPRHPGHIPGARYDPFAPDFTPFDPDPFSSGRRGGPTSGRPPFGGFERKPNFDDYA